MINFLAGLFIGILLMILLFSKWYRHNVYKPKSPEYVWVNPKRREPNGPEFVCPKGYEIHGETKEENK